MTLQLDATRLMFEPVTDWQNYAQQPSGITTEDLSLFLKSKNISNQKARQLSCASLLVI